MDGNSDDKKIYIVVSQTGTIISKLLKIITRKEYNHSSISLKEDLSIMYSFGRLNPYNPFLGGFVIEAPNYGTFKRFNKTQAIVLCLDIDSETHNNIQLHIDSMLKEKEKYKYNFLGLVLAAIKVKYKNKHSYYCSEFISEVLINNKIKGAEKLGKIVHPMNFLTIPDVEIVYKGLLNEYKLSN